MENRMYFFIVLLTTLSTGTNVLGIDCGCPETCTSEALGESNGAVFGCGARIEYLMKHHDLPEANACATASRGGPYDSGGDDDNIRPCRYEACHPAGCGSELTIVPNFHLLHNCGCPESCTDDVMDETLPNMPWSCKARLEYMVHYHHNHEWDACEMAADEGYCNAQKCRPDQCGSNLDKPATQTKATEPPPEQTSVPSENKTNEKIESSSKAESSTASEGDADIWKELSDEVMGTLGNVDRRNPVESSSKTQSTTTPDSDPVILFESSEEAESTSNNADTGSLAEASSETKIPLINNDENPWKELSEEVVHSSSEITKSSTRSSSEFQNKSTKSSTGSSKIFIIVSAIIAFAVGSAMAAALMIFLLSERSVIAGKQSSRVFSPDTLPTHSIHEGIPSNYTDILMDDHPPTQSEREGQHNARDLPPIA